MLSFLIGLIDPITRIATKIADTRIAMANAQTDQERIKLEERLQALKSRQGIMEREADSKINQCIRAALAIPVVAFLWKVIIWDKIWPGGSTEDLSDNLWYVVMLVLGFYFVHWTVGAWKK